MDVWKNIEFLEFRFPGRDSKIMMRCHHEERREFQDLEFPPFCAHSTDNSILLLYSRQWKLGTPRRRRPRGTVRGTGHFALLLVGLRQQAREETVQSQFTQFQLERGVAVGAVSATGEQLGLSGASENEGFQLELSSLQATSSFLLQQLALEREALQSELSSLQATS